jgi:hypothetical protein
VPTEVLGPGKRNAVHCKIACIFGRVEGKVHPLIVYTANCGRNLGFWSVCVDSPLFVGNPIYVKHA